MATSKINSSIEGRFGTQLKVRNTWMSGNSAINLEMISATSLLLMVGGTGEGTVLGMYLINTNSNNSNITIDTIVNASKITLSSQTGNRNINIQNASSGYIPLVAFVLNGDVAFA